jgi:tetratricopeptide (TPR) repeat protein
MQCLRQYGAVLMWQGAWEQAEPLLQKAADRAQMRAVDDVEVALSWNLLGVLYKFSGRFNQAEDAYARAQIHLERAGVDDHPLAATLAHNWGGLAFSRGDYQAGEVEARRSVWLRTASQGATRRDVVSDVAARAAILAQQGRLDEAAADLEMALDAYERLHGRLHLDWAVTANNLGVVEGRRGNPSRAEYLLEQALRAKEHILGADAVDVAVTLINLVDLYSASGRLDLARSLWERAKAIAEQRVNSGHPLACAVRERTPKINPPAEVSSVPSADCSPSRFTEA